MNTRQSKRRKVTKDDEVDLEDFVLDDEDPEWSPGDDEDLDETKELFDLQETDQKTYNKFLEVRAEIRKTEPDVMKILHAELLLPDQAELLQLFELYKTMQFSEESIALKKRIYEKFNDAKNRYVQHQEYTNREHKRFEEEIKELESYNEGQEMKYRILALNTSMQNKSIIYNGYKRLQTLPSDGDECHKLGNWLKWAISLPHDNYITFPFNKRKLTSFLQEVARRLDHELYGMERVKEQILVFVSNKIQNPHMKKCSLGLIGAPGTGKTRICRVLANVLGFPFEQISMGGVADATFLKGNRSLYIGSEPGEIVKALCRMKHKNGILFLDEYDKIENHDVCSALLHITDSSQNSTFMDTFLSGIQIDLSYLWFVYSMNNLPADDALRDRVFVVEVEGYSRDDKVKILSDYMLREALRNVKIDEKSVTFAPGTAEYIVDRVSQDEEQGVRSIEKAIESIVRKVSFLKSHQDRRGNLDFNVSFNMNRRVKFPLVLTKQIVDSCMQETPRLVPL
jgi:ATP-dependent Lon protease